MKLTNVLKIVLALATINISTLKNAEALPVDNDGWTILSPSSDSKIVYVDPNASGTGARSYSAAEVGSDPRNPQIQIVPYKDFNTAKAQLRANSPDWLLLKKGTLVTTNLSLAGLSGRSESERKVLTTYGSGPRPILKTSAGAACLSLYSGSVNNLAITGYECQANSSDFGLFLYSSASKLLLEDMKFSGYAVNVQVYTLGVVNGFALRRSIVANGGAQGMLIEGAFANETDATRTGKVSDVLLEDNFIYRNGMSPDLRHHHIYVATRTEGFVARGNFISDTGSHGIMARWGGVIENNLMTKNPINIQCGSDGAIENDGNPYDNPTTAPRYDISCRVEKNVILDAINIPNSTQERGFGIWLKWVNGGGRVAENLLAGNTGTYPFGIILSNRIAEASTQNVDIEKNVVYNFRHCFQLDTYSANSTYSDNKCFQNSAWTRNPMFDGINSAGSMTFAGNQTLLASGITRGSISGLTHSSLDTSDFSDPTRNIATYMTSIGKTGSLTAYINEVLTMSRDSWDARMLPSAINEYIRQGFGMSKAPQPPECRADLNDDQAVTIDDLLDFLRYFEEGSAQADLDNGSMLGIKDQAVDINDLLYFTAAFENGCNPPLPSGTVGE